MDETLTAIEQVLGIYGSPVSAVDEIERLQRALVVCEQERDRYRAALERLLDRLDRFGDDLRETINAAVLATLPPKP